MELRDLELKLSVSDEAFTGDLYWSVEALSNILKNCMEHTPAGGRIEIKASENALYTEIIVSDSGPGIDPEDLPHLFERFYKGKNSSENTVGIGLALSRMIAAEQNGIIKAENGKARGAVFTLRFYKRFSASSRDAGSL
jgi:signal transduction histidine kinase